MRFSRLLSGDVKRWELAFGRAYAVKATGPHDRNGGCFFHPADEFSLQRRTSLQNLEWIFQRFQRRRLLLLNVAVALGIE